MKYKQISTIIVTTAEALENCLKDHPTMFCIEDPLFSVVFQTVLSDPRLKDYDIRIHSADRYIILLRVIGPRRFDPGKHRFIYQPRTL